MHDRVGGGQLRGDKECPFSGITNSGRVWRKVRESDAQSVTHTHTQEAAFLVQIYIANDISARTVFTCYIMSADSVSLTFTFGPLCAVALDCHRQ